MNFKEIEEILKTADGHIVLLNCLEKQLNKAVNQIFQTEEIAVEKVKNIFSELKETLINVLNHREQYLLDQIRKIKQEGLTPLKECQKIISQEINSTKRLIATGQSVLDNDVSKDLGEFTRDARLLGRLPEVPELRDVPYISFCYEKSTKNTVKNVLTNFGNISGFPPVQIIECIEQPGALLIGWQQISGDDRSDIQEFRLQRAFGDVTKDQHLVVNFKDCYLGLDNQYLVKDLLPHQSYSFRICCKFEGNEEWSTWSLPQVFSTSLRPFCWKLNENCVLSMEDKIAEPVKDKAIICSDDAQFSVGNSIEFTLLEVGSNEATIGLVQGDFNNSLKTSKSSFLVNDSGKIFIDGCEKLTVLPKFAKGLKVCFSSEPVNEEKVRINIDSDDKRVTYDWPIHTNSKMYFAAQFNSVNWKILVE